MSFLLLLVWVTLWRLEGPGMVGAVGPDRLVRWAEAALDWPDPSLALAVTPKHSIRVYVAQPTPQGRVVALSADGGTRHGGAHDAVLVLDPRPGAPFAHPVHVFYLDLHLSKQQCHHRQGILLDGGDCLQLAVRKRCHRWGRRSGACHMLYLPEVRISGSKDPREDRLTCVPLPGFHSSCPRLRPPRPPLCDPFTTNSKACDTTSYIRTDCPFMQTCDHAVLISGGWNRQMGNEDSLKNVLAVNTLLQQNGFIDTNIKIFFADGLNKSELEVLKVQEVYPSGLKLALRYHLQTLCETARCADSLVIYMNSPTRPDGASLLWDSDSNGEYDETEVYTPREFLRDIQGCSARRTIVIVDQKYGKELVRLAHRHLHLRHVVILASPELEDGSYDRNELTKKLLSVSHDTTCFGDFIQSIENTEQLSKSLLSSEDIKFTGDWPHLLNATLSGAPCDLDFPAREELKKKYFGCQNLSTLEMLEPDQTMR